jgi:hypothetical protein
LVVVARQHSDHRREQALRASEHAYHSFVHFSSRSALVAQEPLRGGGMVWLAA